MNILVDIENVRTFAGRHQKIPVRPLTLLTGENSSGKTAFLACLSAMSDEIGFPLDPSFDAPPYSLGTYDTIAAYKGGSSGRAKAFSLGWTDPSDAAEVVATYENREGAARLHTFRSRDPRRERDISLEVDDAGDSCAVSIAAPNQKRTLTFSLPHVGTHHNRGLQAALAFGLAPKVGPGDFDFEFGRFSLQPTTSIGPVRSQPKRTYDPGTEGFNPEGRHIPYLLAGLPDLSALEQFGDESGLFRHIEVKYLGKKGTDPFQVLVNVGGRSINLLDVGYGVSQSLPILVEGLRQIGPRVLLIQEPEVHLHPTAQAALGTFFCKLVNGNVREFVIETHSDYIVDRIRREVAQKNISRESVIILYFERNGLSTTVHPLELDEAGNILNAPPSYREFFLREEMDLLTRV